MKLPLREPEHAALREELSKWEGFVCSALLRVEAVRACARYGGKYAERAREGLASIALLPVDEPILDAASGLMPSGLRTLDAIHLATALSIAADLGVVVTYDARLAEAAVGQGLTVSAPR